MQSKEKKIWFPAKRYGWGWGPPCAWQGWVVLAVFLVVSIGGTLLLGNDSKLKSAFLIVMVSAFLLICWIKGEKLRWRWGKD